MQRKKKLIDNGNGWLLYINKSIIKYLGINENNKDILLTIKNKKLYAELTRQIPINNESNIKKLFKRGSGYGFYIELLILDILGINPEKDFLNLDIDGNRLIIKKDDI